MDTARADNTDPGSVTRLLGKVRAGHPQAFDALVPLADLHERLGPLYEARGEPEEAAAHYSAFVELWQDADPELQPRVQAAQVRLKEILTERAWDSP